MRTTSTALILTVLAAGGCQTDRGETDFGRPAGSDDGGGGGDGAGGDDGAGDDGGGDGGGDDDGGGGAGDDGGGGGGGDTKFDLGEIPDFPGEGGCGDGDGPGGDNGLLTYIWIANSGQSPATVSKIHTQTMLEEGRYQTRPDGSGNPSRTSVNLNADMAVANRSGGVTKILANHDDCPNTNPAPGLQTSTGGNDVLAWGEDECVAWHTPLQCGSNRPMAWTRGEWNEATCRYENAKLWTACDQNVLLLNGDTGVPEATIPVVGAGMLYGGAVDGDGNFWMVQTYTSLYRVDRNTLTVESWPLAPGGPGYGIAVDSQGRPWTCGGGNAARFDPLAHTWQVTAGPAGDNNWGGCMTDGAGTLYHSRVPEGVMVAIDTDSVTVVAEYPIPDYVHGVSVDFDGYVWGVQSTLVNGAAGTQAYRLDVDTGHVDVFDGLIGAYTYSDMTGFALANAGGAPAG